MRLKVTCQAIHQLTGGSNPPLYVTSINKLARALGVRPGQQLMSHLGTLKRLGFVSWLDGQRHPTLHLLPLGRDIARGAWSPIVTCPQCRLTRAGEGACFNCKTFVRVDGQEKPLG